MAARGNAWRLRLLPDSENGHAFVASGCVCMVGGSAVLLRFGLLVHGGASRQFCCACEIVT